MKIIYNRLIPFGRFFAINLFGVLFVKGRKEQVTEVDLNHELIHTAQMKELWYLSLIHISEPTRPY